MGVEKRVKKIVWNDIHQKAFDDIRKIIAWDVILAYPIFSRPFEAYMDVSKLQLGVVIMQDNCLIAFYHKKLTSAQCNYTTMEKELLSIVECFKRIQEILLNQQITMYTDYNNLVHKMSGMTSE